MSTDTFSNRDVLIVGAGPCGLTLAHELLHRGIQPRIIDKNAAASQETKASGIMTRTLELLTPSGIAEEMVARGVKEPILSIYSEGHQLACFDFGRHVDSVYSYVLTLPQSMTEEILTQHVIGRGGNIERSVELINLEQQEEGVGVVLRHADGREERSRTRWLVGCDGAHSMVRHLVGATFIGRTLEQSFATGNVRMHWNVPSDQILACLKRGNFIAYFPLAGGRYRFVIAYQPEDAPTGEITLDEIQHVVDVCGPEGARVSDPTGLARYQINERKVNHYLWQHAVLVGDAAHIHSPVGGQGMNTGIQDAFNLAWKLALVVQGKASERLLESYASEREEVGRQLVQRTGLFTRLALRHQPLAIAARDMIIPHVTRLEKVQQAFTATMAELSIAYRHSPLVSEYHGEKTRPGHSPVKAGDRAPDGPVTTATVKAPGRLYELLNGNRHVLLIFAHQKEIRSELQHTLREWQDWLDVYLIQRSQPDGEGKQAYYDPDGSLAQRYGIADEGLVLIRPDGYIALRSQPIATEPLQRYFTTISSPARPSAIVG